MDFQQIIQRARHIRTHYAAFEEKKYGNSWTNEEIALGFMGDVGDLAKLIVAENGRREIPNSTEKLAHELADCLWSVIILADAHGIDIEHTFLKTMDELEDHLKGQVHA
jgi:NTP pyrophosphatase (non-canonical NTP hydrolase)